MGQVFGLRQRGLTVIICLVTSDKKKKVPQNTLKLKSEHHFFFFFVNTSWNHLSGLTDTLHKAMTSHSVVFLCTLFGSH